MRIKNFLLDNMFMFCAFSICICSLSLFVVVLFIGGNPEGKIMPEWKLFLLIPLGFISLLILGALPISKESGGI